MSGRAATDTVIPGRHALSVGNPQTETPEGWSWLPLGELATMGTGHTPSRSVSAYWDGDVQWMGIRDARAHHGGEIWNTAQTITQAGLDNSSARLLPAGTVALSRTASVGYVVQLGREMATSQDFVTWTCSAALDPLFLMRTIQAEGDDIRNFGEGSTHTTIYFPELKALHVRTPPVPEQRRIVAKIDRLSARSTRAREDLERVPSLVERYRAELLKAAFNGGLTEAWRDSNDVSTPWRSASLGELGRWSSGGTPKSSDGALYDGNIPWIRSGDLPDAEISTHVKTISEAGFAQSSVKWVPAGSVLIAMYGATIGKLGITTYPVTTNQAVAALAPFDDVFNKWAFYLLRNLRPAFISAGQGGAQPNISQHLIKSFVVDLPELKEQHEIVRRIEHAFAAIDRLAAEATSAQKLLDRLDQAVLAKAFRGELVPQDPNDEPASVLLERIRAECAAAPALRRGRRPKVAPE